MVHGGHAKMDAEHQQAISMPSSLFERLSRLMDDNGSCENASGHYDGMIG